MAPASTIASSQTNLTSDTNATANAKSLKDYKQDTDFFHKISAIYKDCDPKDFDVWLISVPEEFPDTDLSNIPLVPNASIPLEITSNRASAKASTEKYICQSKTSNCTKSAIIPTSSEDSVFCCKTIEYYVHVRENLSTCPVEFSNCLPRPPPPGISKHLKERLKPIGWQMRNCASDTSSKMVEHANGTEISDNKRKSKKRKKEKKDKKTDHEHREKSKKHKKKKL